MKLLMPRWSLQMNKQPPPPALPPPPPPPPPHLSYTLPGVIAYPIHAEISVD